MEHIKSALKKAGVLEEHETSSLEQTVLAQAPQKHATGEKNKQGVVPPTLREVNVDPKHLANMRIVSQSMNDPNHIAFNLLRTRVRKAMSDNKWRSLAITSPTPSCGKTMITLNLAYSLARNPGLRTVAVDLDLKRPSVARTLKIEPDRSIAQYLLGRAQAEDCFVQVDPNLIVGLNSGHTPASSELIQAPKMLELMDYIETHLQPDVVLFDLPPMRSSDDALGFLPRVDTALLIVAAGMTTTAEVDECELQMNELDKLLGVVLNKCKTIDNEEYYY